MPRAQSIETERAVARSALSWDDLRGHLKIDVRIQRMPHRTILIVREVDGPFHRIGGHSAFDVEVQVDLEKPVGIRLGTMRRQPCSKMADLVAPLCQDVDEVGGHAASQREHERLHGRGARVAVAVNRDGRLARLAAELEVADPGEIRDDRRLPHAQDLWR